jgi:hypothetical protein
MIAPVMLDREPLAGSLTDIEAFTPDLIHAGFLLIHGALRLAEYLPAGTGKPANADRGGEPDEHGRCGA